MYVPQLAASSCCLKTPRMPDADGNVVLLQLSHEGPDPVVAGALKAAVQDRIPGYQIDVAAQVVTYEQLGQLGGQLWAVVDICHERVLKCHPPSCDLHTCAAPLSHCIYAVRRLPHKGAGICCKEAEQGKF